jgi:methylglutaconyl-CoA hydratase
MSEPLVRYEVMPPAVVITLNRADKRNALSRALIAELTAAFERAREDAAARCVVLTAAGPVFCAGMDLAELQASLDAPAEASPVWDDALRLARLYDLIYTLPKPTIAAVQGSAVAGGAGLVTVCDLAVTVPAAKFGYPEVRRGLVNVVVPPERLLGHALELARAGAEGGPNALARTKAFLQQFSRQAVSIEEAAQASAAPRLTDECQQGLRAFFAKQPVPWTLG